MLSQWLRRHESIRKHDHTDYKDYGYDGVKGGVMNVMREKHDEQRKKLTLGMEDVGRQDGEGQDADRLYLRGQQDQPDAKQVRENCCLVGWCCPLLGRMLLVLDLCLVYDSEKRGLGACSNCISL